MEKINPRNLVRVGNFTFRPIDLKYIEWDYNDSLGETRTGFWLHSVTDRGFTFKISDPSYTTNKELLMFFSDSENWLTESEINT
jgi:hypothetical protein